MLTGQTITTTTTDSLETIRIASALDGGDCGAKINTAELQLSTDPGEIWVNNTCGTTWTTPVTISHDNHVLRFNQPGTSVSSAAITLSGKNEAIWTAFLT
jgi:hypothetical protein